MLPVRVNAEFNATYTSKTPHHVHLFAGLQQVDNIRPTPTQSSCVVLEHAPLDTSHDDTEQACPSPCWKASMRPSGLNAIVVITNKDPCSPCCIMVSKRVFVTVQFPGDGQSSIPATQALDLRTTCRCRTVLKNKNMAATASCPEKACRRGSLLCRYRLCQ